LIVDGLPVYHRVDLDAGATAPAIVHVHGFGISGTYLEPTAALLAPRYRTFVPDLPGMGRSHRPTEPLDLPGLARAVVAYCDAAGVGQATFVGNSLGCPILIELAARFPDRIDRVVLVSPAGGPNNQPLPRALRQMITGPDEADILQRGQLPGVGRRRQLSQSTRQVLALEDQQPGLVVLPRPRPHSRPAAARQLTPGDRHGNIPEHRHDRPAHR